MKEEDDALKRFQDSFKGKDVNFHILEHRVPVELQMEYFRYSGGIRKDREKGKVEEDNYELCGMSLTDPSIEPEVKRYILALLATSRDVRAYRILEDYVQHPDEEVRDWAYMALMECRISLETVFSDEKQVYISTGLGGKGDKLRFFTLLLSKGGKPFLDYQRKEIERELAYALPQADCEIERLAVCERHVELVFLAPVRADLKKMIEGVINECNQYGNPLSDTFTITNVKELTPQEIADIIDKDGDDKASR